MKKSKDDFKGVDFRSIRQYIDGLNDCVYSKSSLQPLFQAMEDGITATTLEENLGLIDYVVERIDLRKFENPYSTSVALYNAGRVEVIDGVKQYCRCEQSILKAMPATPPAAATQTENEFDSIVNRENISPSELYKRLQTLMDEHKGKPNEIGAIFFRCRVVGYIKRNPTNTEISRWFGEGIKANRNYMPLGNTSDRETAERLADNIEIFGGDEQEKWQKAKSKHKKR